MAFSPSNLAVERVLDFANAVFRRADGVHEFDPEARQPDWADRPARFRSYPGQPRVRLPGPLTLQSRWQQQSAVSHLAVPGLQQLATVLHLAMSPLRRRLDLTWNDSAPPIDFLKQEYGRGTASGGGLYPTQCYIVAQGQAGLDDGVYHYAELEHALVMLRPGAHATRLQRAVGGGAAGATAWLVLSTDFWCNVFKYFSFGYHVCSLDSGLMLAALGLSSRALGIDARGYLLFDDAAVNTVIGADGGTEAALVVLALGDAQSSAPEADDAPLPPVVRAWQRSRRVLVADALRQMHTVGTLDAASVQALVPALTRKPNPPEAATAAPAIEDALLRALPSVLLSRRSAWGSLRGPTPLPLSRLEALLSLAWRAGGLPSCWIRESLPDGALCIHIYAQHVDGLATGAWTWDPLARSFHAREADNLPSWQETYAMENYNIDDVGCQVFIAVDLPRVLAQAGPRGYRVLNAWVGALVHLLYVGAAALQLDCGAVLGVRAQRVKGLLRLPADENVCIGLYLSSAQPRVAFFDFHLAPDLPV